MSNYYHGAYMSASQQVTFDRLCQLMGVTDVTVEEEFDWHGFGSVSVFGIAGSSCSTWLAANPLSVSP